MILLSTTMGLAAAVFLLTAGYLFGARQGYAAREQLRRENLAQAEDLARLRERLAQQIGEGEEGLRAAIERLLTPLVQRERLSLELSDLKAQAGRHGELTALLDQIAEKGNFAAVLLSDQGGWPIAASRQTRDLERLGAIASLLVVVADRIKRDGGTRPLSLMIHDEASQVTLCRIFRAGDQGLSLTAVSTGTQLTPTALDPALGKVEGVLTAPGR